MEKSAASGNFPEAARRSRPKPAADCASDEESGSSEHNDGYPQVNRPVAELVVTLHAAREKLEAGR